MSNVLELRHEREVAFRIHADEVVNVGRNAKNAWVLADTSISRFHASIRWEGGSPWVEDLGSANGTAINGEALRPKQARLLQAGSTLRLGTLSFKVHLLEEEAPPALLGDSSSPVGVRLLGLNPEASKLSGRVKDWDDAQGALLQLERLSVSGTWTIDFGKQREYFTLLMGSVLITPEDAEALVARLREPPVNGLAWHFSAELQVGTAPDLGMRPSELIQLGERSGGFETERFTSR